MALSLPATYMTKNDPTTLNFSHFEIGCSNGPLIDKPTI